MFVECELLKCFVCLFELFIFSCLISLIVNRERGVVGFGVLLLEVGLCIFEMFVVLRILLWELICVNV